MSHTFLVSTTKNLDPGMQAHYAMTDYDLCCLQVDTAYTHVYIVTTSKTCSVSIIEITLLHAS
jgi:hypothetical protein